MKVSALVTTVILIASYGAGAVTGWTSQPLAAARSVVGEFLSSISSIRVAGDHAYCAAEPGLLIYDLSDPSNPRMISHLLLGESGCFKLAVSGDYAYVLSGMVYLERSFLHVIKIRDPRNPALVSTYSDLVPSQVSDLVVEGARVFVANANHVDVLDASNPARLTRLSRFDVIEAPQAVTSLVLRGTALFAGWAGIGGGGVVCIDMADPRTPVRVGELTIDGTVEAMAGERNTLYVAAMPQGLCILDASDPTNMTLVRTISFGSRFARSLFADDGYLFLEVHDLVRALTTICVYDITSPLSPKIIGRTQSPGLVSGMDFDSTGMRAFLPWFTESGNGLGVAELGQDGSLKPVGQALEPAIADIAISRGTVFLAASNSLLAVKMHSGAKAEILGSVSLPQGAIRVRIARSRAYVTTNRGVQPLHPQLQIVDVADPARMKLLASVPLEELAGVGSEWYSGNLHVQGELLYFPHAKGFSILDVSSPTQVQPVGTFSTPDPGEHIYVSGNLAFLSVLHWIPDLQVRRIDLYIVDVSTASAPVLRGKLLGLKHADFTNDVALQQGYLYHLVAGPGYGLGVVGDGRLLITDVRNPDAPVLVSQIPTNPSRNGYAMRLFVREQTVYVADGLDGVSVLSLKDRSNPRFLRSIATPGFALGVWADQSRRIHVADSSSYLVWPSATDGSSL